MGKSAPKLKLELFQTNWSRSYIVFALGVEKKKTSYFTARRLALKKLFFGLVENVFRTPQLHSNTTLT